MFALLDNVLLFDIGLDPGRGDFLPRGVEKGHRDDLSAEVNSSLVRPLTSSSNTG